MDEGLKRRLVGATVLVSLAVIFVPMLLERDAVVDEGITHSNIPPRPQTDFSSRILPLEENRALEPVEEITPVTESAGGDSDPDLSGAPTGERSSLEEPPTLPEETAEPLHSRVGLSAWVIQVGSFSQRENADGLSAELQKLGFPAFIEQAEVNRKQVFRVRVGPEVDRKRAEEMMVEINRTLKPKKLTGTLKRYP